MTREEIYKAASEYVDKTHSPSEVSDYQAAMNISSAKAFTEGAKWMKEELMQKSYMWMRQHFMEFIKIENLGSCAHEITIYGEKLWDRYSKAMEE